MPERDVLHTLTDHERRMVAPYVERFRRAQQQAAELEDALVRMVALAHPIALDQGVQIDFVKGEIWRAPAEKPEEATDG